jgi:hypothetical protein
MANKTAAGAIEGARKQLGELRSFVIEKKLVTIPGQEEARVAETLPYERWKCSIHPHPGTI